MEKIFSPNRWFVLFCALLIFVWGALKLVADMNLAEYAKAMGAEVFTWSWTADPQQRSRIESVSAKVLARNANDATVEVIGTQLLQKSGNNDGEQAPDTAAKDKVRAVLTFYRLNNQWELGKVEID